MRFHVLASGSKGNATLLEHAGQLLLLDMGVSRRCLKEALTAIDHAWTDIMAILLTHEHSDHSSGLGLVRDLPLYCTEGTKDGLADEDTAERCHIIRAYETFSLIGLSITPVTILHDAEEPVGFLITDGEKKIVFLTDTGFIPEKTLTYLADADYYIFEANHDERLLHRSDRPVSLKRRILSARGHLANEDAAMYLADLVGPRTKEIVLAHLSEECNTPELALKAVRKALGRKVDPDQLLLRTAEQRRLLTGGRS